MLGENVDELAREIEGESVGEMVREMRYGAVVQQGMMG